MCWFPRTFETDPAAVPLYGIKPRLKSLKAPRAQAFVQATKGYAEPESIDLIRFEQFERNDERTQA